MFVDQERTNHLADLPMITRTGGIVSRHFYHVDEARLTLGYILFEHPNDTLSMNSVNSFLIRTPRENSIQSSFFLSSVPNF
jgi:hypothetical protein